MSQKRAKERRKQGLDRRQVSARNSAASLAIPQSQTQVFDPATVAFYQLARGQIDDLLMGDDGLLRVLPAREYAQIPRPFLHLWALEMGYHLFPTEELVGWLRAEIGASQAIEICAGAGVLGRALGVPCIDWDVCGRFPWVGAWYGMHGQPTPMIGGHCERMEALEAVAKYKPEVVFGGYVTQRVFAGEPSAAGSVYGVDEQTIIRCVRKYIVIGSWGVHGGKKIAKKMTRNLSPDWVVTRTPNPADQAIFIWDNPSPEPLRDVLRISEQSPIPVPSAAPPPALASKTAGLLHASSRMQR